MKGQDAMNDSTCAGPKLLRPLMVLDRVLSVPGGARFTALLKSDLGLNCSTLTRHLQALVKGGYLVKDGREGMYRAGPACTRFAARFAEARATHNLQEGVVRDLSDELELSAACYAVEGDQFVLTCRAVPHLGIQIIEVGQAVSMPGRHAMALAVLAASEAGEASRLMKAWGVSKTRAKSYRSVLRRTGVLREDHRGTRSRIARLGAVVRGAKGGVVGAVGVVAAPEELDDKPAQAADAVRRAAERATRVLDGFSSIRGLTREDPS